jgi:peptide/nickel transport system substrate-binding protein
VDERLPSALAVYERFGGFVPRSNGVVSFTSGPKIAHFDRLEWHTIPDPGTAVAALLSGEVDWVELTAWTRH